MRLTSLAAGILTFDVWPDILDLLGRGASGAPSQPLTRLLHRRRSRRSNLPKISSSCPNRPRHSKSKPIS